MANQVRFLCCMSITESIVLIQCRLPPPQVDGQKSGGQPLLGGMDVRVQRNFFGSQVSSFETDLQLCDSGLFADRAPVRALFIRAPVIVASGAPVETLATYSGEHGENVIVAAKQNNLLCTSFHPELTADSRWHQLFVDICRRAS